MLKTHRLKNAAASLILFFLALLIGTILLFYHGQADFFFLDLQFMLSRLFSAADTISDQLVIILVDNQSQAGLQLRPGSENRQYHRQLLEKLGQAGASVIAFDITFITHNEKADKEFAAAIKKSGNVIGGEIEEDTTVKVLKDSFTATGSIYAEDSWAIPRRIFVHPNQTAQKAFSLVIAEAFYSRNKTGQEKDKIIWPQDHFWINYAYKPDHFPLFTYAEILAADAERIADKKRTPLSILKDKIILVGYDQEQSNFPPLTGQKLPGIYAHAYAVESLLNASRITPVGLPVNLFLLLLTLIIVQLLSTSGIHWLKLTGPWLWLAVLFGFQYGILFPSHLWANYAALFFGSLSLKVLNASLDRIKNVRTLNRLKKEMREFVCLKEKIEQAEELKDTFIESVFHDIKNHVGSIETTSEMIIARSNSDPNLLRKIGIIRLACQNIAYLSRNLLEVKQMEEGKLKINREFLSREQVEALARKFCADPLCEVKNINVKIESDAGDSFTINADNYLLGRVLHNLFDNAFKYSFANGEVKFACLFRGGKMLISLFNTGTPLTAEQRELIFGKYYRVQPLATKAVPNSYSRGIGLYFCKLIMQAHGGHIWAESNEAGNFFYLDFTQKETATKAYIRSGQAGAH